MSVLRIVTVGGLLSYRALFSWARPALYIPTLLGSPLFQILFFAYVGRSAAVQSDSFFVVGNAVQVSAMAGVYGMAMAIGGERFTGTLSAILSSPANRAALFLGRTLPYLLNGVLVSAFGFLVGTLLLDFHLMARTLPALAVAVAVSSASRTPSSRTGSFACSRSSRAAGRRSSWSD
jgi:ABC-2 type transport system permease protein